MKKYFPFILLFLGIVVVVGAFIFVKSHKKTDSVVEEDESSLINVSIPDSPIVSITPRENGHWVDLKISNLGKFDAKTFEYQLLFKVPKSGLQGESGIVKLADTENNEYTKEVLVGTESSGNYYYYNNVEEGQFLLKFRDSNGKLVAKFATDLHFQNDVDEVTTLDGSFKYKLDEASKEYFITMGTFGANFSDSSIMETLGIFTSWTDPLPGEVTYDGGNIKALTDSGLQDLSAGKSENVGLFAITK